MPSGRLRRMLRHYTSPNQRERVVEVTSMIRQVLGNPFVHYRSPKISFHIFSYLG